MTKTFSSGLSGYQGIAFYRFRVKVAEFLSQGFTVEIPKSLVLADVAIRLLYRAYDNMSPRCSTYRLKSKEKKPQDPILVTVVPEEEQADKVVT